MKVKTIEIAWHRRPEAAQNDPVFTVDFLDETVFATGGGDHEIWRLNTETEEPTVEYCCSLKGHTQSVNVVRFSPNKKLLASAGDDGSVFIWGLQEKVCKNWCEIKKENCYWKKCIRGHAMDIYDISWCPNSQFLVSSGTDSNVIVWDIAGTQYTRINEHSGYIQGIEWTQDDNTIISVSNDRTARVYSYSRGKVNPFLQVDDLNAMRTPKKEYRISKNIMNNKPLVCKTTLKKMLFDYASVDPEIEPEAEPSSELGSQRESEVKAESQPNSEPSQGERNEKTEKTERPEGEEEVKSAKGYFMFLGDTAVPSFYRRPSSSKEGLFAVIPCGVYLEKEGSVPRNCSYLYVNGIYERPFACLPVFQYPTVVCRFSPVQYQVEEEGMMSVIGVPYYHVVAVTTTEEVFIYSTNANEPLFYITNIHYAQICDFAWNESGRFAFTASSDGYCTLLSFEEGELGKRSL